MIPNGLAEIKRFFGDPTKGKSKWERANIVSVPLPFDMSLAWALGSVIDTVRLHKKAAPDFIRRQKLVWEHAQAHVKNELGWHASQSLVDHKALEWLHSQGLTLWGGGYNYRQKRGSSELSVHSYGGAWDIDPSHNQMGTAGRIPKWYVDIWTTPDDSGNHWVWGGTFSTPDCMHFQFCMGY